MYGLVNRAIEQLVVSTKGEPAWQRVCARAGVGADGFVAMCPYDDRLTFDLVHAVSEELGLPATLGVILCYVVIAIAGCGIAMQATHIFSRLLALGLTFIIVVPAMVNIGVTTAVLPNDGLPLPFVSYGGTSLVFSLMAVGMLVGIHRRSQPKVAEEFPLTRETRLAVRL